MKTVFTLFIIFFISTGLFAQKFVQEWYIPLPGLASSEATAIMTTSDNQTLIAGYSNTNSSVGSMFFMKTDTAGNVIRTSFSEEQFVWTYPMANRLMKDIDNNYVMIGYYSYYQKTYFTRLSPVGDILDAHVSNDNYWGGYDMEQTTDSGFLVSVYSNWDLSLRKLNNSGLVEWDTTFADTASAPIHGRLYGMAKVDDSTFVVTGMRDYIPGSLEDLDVLMAKIRVWDDSVKVLKLKIFQQDGANEQGYDILTLPDDEGYIICGVGANENSPNNTVGVIMRTDTAGNQKWKKTYSRALNSNTSFIRILLDDDENILVLAQTSAGSNDVSLLKYSTDGELLQKKHFDYGGNETAHDFTIDQDGKIFVAVGANALLLKVKDICPLTAPRAALEDTTPEMGGNVVVHVLNTNDAWSYNLMQIKGEKTLGTLQGNGDTLDFTAAGLTIDDVADGLVVSVVEPGVDCIEYSDTLFMDFANGVEDLPKNRFLIQPNPFQDNITVTFDDEKNMPFSMKIFNINGLLLLEKTNIVNQQEINLSRLPEGIYFIGLKDMSGRIIYKKVVKY